MRSNFIGTKCSTPNGKRSYWPPEFHLQHRGEDDDDDSCSSSSSGSSPPRQQQYHSSPTYHYYTATAATDIYTLGLVFSQIASGMDIEDLYFGGNLNAIALQETLTVNNYKKSVWDFLYVDFLNLNAKQRSLACKALENDYISELNLKFKSRKDLFATSLRVDGSIKMARCLQNFADNIQQQNISDERKFYEFTSLGKIVEEEDEISSSSSSPSSLFDYDEEEGEESTTSPPPSKKMKIISSSSINNQ